MGTQNKEIVDPQNNESWALKLFKEMCCDGCACHSDKDHAQD